MVTQKGISYVQTLDAVQTIQSRPSSLRLFIYSGFGADLIQFSITFQSHRYIQFECQTTEIVKYFNFRFALMKA